MLKKILSLILILSFTVLCTANASAQTVNTSNAAWSYIIYDKNGEQLEEGAIPNSLLRYSWSGVTLLNGQTVKFVPSNNSKGLYCAKGTRVTFFFRHQFQLGRGTVTQRIFDGSNYVSFTNYFTATPGYWQFDYVMRENNYTFGEVTNYSSDPLRVYDVRINF